MTVRNLLVLALAFTSGYIDALSYLGLGRVFTSNMTGNTVLLGLALGQAKGLDAARSALALVGFVVGVALGSTIVDRGTRRSLWPAEVTRAFVMEFIILLAFAAAGFSAGAPTGDATLYVLITLSAVAMGIQGTAVRTLGVSGIVTTYITGTWTNLVAGMTSRLRSAVDGGEESRKTSPSAPSSPDVTVLQAEVLVVYIVAAVSGAVAVSAWLLSSTLAPAIILGIVVLASLVRFRRDW